ncbi:hypothetical protein TSUD_192680 [Trifolium subterraneum]|uniref:RNase H type-1 domain-containing protein n=1 Tax=Trifolium subterraneum TaxID=3900 RepID=A0A2Z6LHH9_TRISU|nr:hypothetical protein TSUD_192680 [Trifolium subterraneum]
MIASLDVEEFLGKEEVGTWIGGFSKGLGECSIVGCMGMGWLEVCLGSRIQTLLELEWEVRVCHMNREANLCADVLAHIGCSMGSNVIF